MNTNHAAGADGHEGSNLQHTLWMWTIIQRGLQENEATAQFLYTDSQTSFSLAPLPKIRLY